jgi:perosamine synthetase
MWPRKQIDIRWTDLARAGLWSVLPERRDRAKARLETGWAPDGDGIVTLSVRSGLDLLLSALALEPGCEILMTAITIDDMRRVVEAHGLVAVPVDLCPENMAPEIENLDRAVSPQTRAIIVAHLFGGRVDMDPILAWASARRVLVIEDCAQAFCSPAERGDPRSDVAMFSFGSIKTSTALGGALLRVRDSKLLAEMRSRQAAWPIASRWRYAAKVAKYGFLKLLACPRVFSCFVFGCRLLGTDYDRLLNRWVRGFGLANLLDDLRRQPSKPLLSVLWRRLHRFDADRIARRAAKGALLARCLGPEPTVLGGRAPGHTHWVFPIVVDDPERCVAALAAAGFDANRGGSMITIPAPADRLALEPHQAARAIRQLVYLPCYVEIPDRELKRMANVVRGSSGSPELPRNAADPAARRLALRNDAGELTQATPLA